MQSRSMQKLAVLVGMALIASLTTSARADFTLTLTDGGTGASIFIDDTTGTYTYSHGATGPTTGSFTIDGTTLSYSAASGTFSPISNSIAFVSNADFGNFKTSVTITANVPGGTNARVFDTNIATKNNGNKGADLTAQVTATGFTAPGSLGSSMLLDNSLAASALDSGRTTFISDLNTQSTTTATVTSTQFGNGNKTDDTQAVVTQTSNPFTLNNTLTLANIAAGDSANVTGTTTATAAATPEPGTIAMALTALPLLGLGAWVRRRRARA
jgi:hypothetical protein